MSDLDNFKIHQSPGLISGVIPNMEPNLLAYIRQTSFVIWLAILSSGKTKNLFTLVFLITDQAPNNHPGHQNSGSS